MTSPAPDEEYAYVVALGRILAAGEPGGAHHPAVLDARPTSRGVGAARSTAAALPGPQLTKRERACLRLIAEGNSDGQIADTLGVGSPTVATHIKNARAKLHAKTRAQAIAHYMLVCLL